VEFGSNLITRVRNFQRNFDEFGLLNKDIQVVGTSNEFETAYKRTQQLLLKFQH